MTRFEELVAKLSELFELDKADLDFGIHRIIKTKHDQITKYLSERLPERVKSVLGELAQAETGDSLAEVKRQVIDGLGTSAFAEDGTLNPAYADTPLGKRYTVAEEEAKYAVRSAQTEAEVYSHLYEFFSRYYEEGDFISRRRRTAGRETYSVPYDGEEVVLHWANKDQYYIKSTEDLKDYTFTVPVNQSGDTARVQFKLTRMDAVQNNNKANRIFVLDEEEGVEASGDSLVIPFHFAEGKKRNQTEEAEWEQAVLDALPEEWQQRLAARDTTYTGDGERSILQKHLRNYTKKNTSDYFIHKDLGGFLRRELDFYIKNEVMYLDDVDSRPADYLEKELRKIKAIRAVAHDLIDFLAQFEDFQKRLWLKKKFVIETNWCITLDRVPEELYPEIAGNREQVEEWEKLGFLTTKDTKDTKREDELDLFESSEKNEPNYQDGKFSCLSCVSWLKKNQNLVLDTAFFPPEFKTRLLAAIDDIDAQTDGLLVHSENFQALGLLQERYREQVKCVYIDPPYNTGGDGFMYKDSYQRSTWASMLSSRLSAAVPISTADGVIFVSFDDNESGRIKCLMEGAFGKESFEAQIIIQSNKRGQTYKSVSKTHEYLMAFGICGPIELGELPKDGDGLPNNDEWGGYELWELRNRNPKFGRFNRPNLFFPIYVDPNSENDQGEASVSLEKSERFSETALPKNSQGEDSCWRWGTEKVALALTASDRQVLVGKKRRDGFWNIYEKARKQTTKPKSIWFETGVINEQGTMQVGDMGFSDFGFPKPILLIQKAAQIGAEDDDFILDYFAGSGTTGHAVIDLNREDGGKRKYILVEMGEYFDTVLKPRIQKVIFSEKWKDGKPVPTTKDTKGTQHGADSVRGFRDFRGSSHCFKYIRLESYEDALNNLTLDDRSADLLGLPEDVQDDYLLRYSLDIETRASLLDLERFENPFDYKLKVYNRETGEAEPHPVDLPETFNYLLGLRVRTMQMRDGFLVIEGENPAAETVLVIWRNVHTQDNAALEAFVTGTLRINPADTEYAAIYINGDTTLDDPHKKILLTEQAFGELMFADNLGF